jgi:phage terminase small subunit
MPGERELTPMQQAFVLAYTSEPNCVANAAASARAAGYSFHTAAEQGRQLLQTPHVRDAIDAANREMLRGRIATKAVHLLERVIDDETANTRDRVAAAKTVLDRSGIVTPSTAERSKESGARKPLATMSRAELDAFIERERKAIALLEQALPPIIDATPGASGMAEAANEHGGVGAMLTIEHAPATAEE